MLHFELHIVNTLIAGRELVFCYVFSAVVPAFPVQKVYKQYIQYAKQIRFLCSVFAIPKNIMSI